MEWIDTMAYGDNGQICIVIVYFCILHTLFIYISYRLLTLSIHCV